MRSTQPTLDRVQATPTRPSASDTSDSRSYAACMALAAGVVACAVVFDGIYKRLEREHHVTERDVAAADDQADEAILARDQTQVRVQSRVWLCKTQPVPAGTRLGVPVSLH